MMLVIFDCDGVLVNSEEIYQIAELEFLATAGLTFDPSAYTRTFMGLSPATWRAQLESIAEERSMPLPAQFFERMEDHTRHRMERHLAAIPGAQDTIKRLLWRRCVASSTPSARLRWKLEHTGLIDLFDPHVFSADLVVRGKPAPDLFLHAASVMGARASECIVVEDSANGVLAGKAAGMKVIGFTAGKHCAGDHGDSLLQSGADMIVAEYDDLEAALSRV